MKTYAETQGRPVTNWVEELNRADPEWGKLYFRAKQWPTCACGNLCEALPRTIYGAPKDDALLDLGMQFSCAIGREDAEYALRILSQIEAHSTVLLTKMSLLPSRP